MHANGYPESTPPVRRRRRRKKKTYRGVGIVAGGLFWAVFLIAGALVLKGSVPNQVAEFTETPPDSLQTDVQAPQITGIRDFAVFTGETISYRQGITVTDDTDAAPQLDVDSTHVDLTTPGIYTVTYTASDASGNRASAKAQVTVLEKPENYVEPDVIQAAADALLDEILAPNMNVREQVCAIYSWAKENLQYGGHSDRADYQQTAYVMLTEKEGDCYGYFALTKLLFERLDIVNVDVRKVKSSETDSDHFWSLVSVDGGDTYYHFDATPRVGQTEELCLVTDTFLDSFDTYHNGCHNRDKSLYPATPEGWS